MKLATIRDEVRAAARGLRRQWAWSATAVATFALAIGAGATAFGVVQTFSVRPLPYRDPSRVVLIWRQDPHSGMTSSPSAALTRLWKQPGGAPGLASVQEYMRGTVTRTGGGDPELLHAAWVEPDLPRFTGIPLILGRSFTTAEATAGGPLVAILGEDLWRRAFGASRTVVGTTIRLDDRSATIVGVAPRALRLPDAQHNGSVDVWLPNTGERTVRARNVMARLSPGVSIATAATLLDASAARAGVDAAGAGGSRITLLTPRDMVGFQGSIRLLAGAVFVLLLIGCANIAHLLISRAVSGRRETAIRATLGASPRDLVRRVWLEVGLLTAGGCVCGAALAWLLIRLLARHHPATLTQLDYVASDGSLLGPVLVLACISGFGCAAVAARHTSRLARSASVGRGLLSTFGTATGVRLRSTILVAEMALSTAVLVMTMTMLHSLIKLQRVKTGFQPDSLYSMRFQLPLRRYPTTERSAVFAREFLGAARAMPGVVSATIAAAPPPMTGFAFGPVVADNGGVLPFSPAALVGKNSVLPDYFSTLRIPIVAGRTFDAASSARAEVVVDQITAARLWPRLNPLGHRLRINEGDADSTAWSTVVGVVGSTSAVGATGFGPEAFIYSAASIAETPADFTVLLRVSKNTDPLPALRRESVALDPLLAPPALVPVSDAIADVTAPQRFTTAILSALSALALLLAAIGLYGVNSWAVSRRSPEIGVRLALGATRLNVVWMVLRAALRPSAIGVLVGFGIAFWGVKLVGATAFATSDKDVLAFGVSGGVLLLVSVVASLESVARASRIDPVDAIRTVT